MFSNVNIGVKIEEKVEEKVEGTNTSYDPEHTVKQDHLCVHPCIHLNTEGGNTEANVEALNISCDPDDTELYCQASC